MKQLKKRPCLSKRNGFHLDNAPVHAAAIVQEWLIGHSSSCSPTLLNGQSHFTLDRIGGADANMSYDVIFNSDFYIEWDVHSHRRILCLVVKYNLDRIEPTTLKFAHFSNLPSLGKIVTG